MDKKKIIIPLFILSLVFSVSGVVSAREAESGGNNNTVNTSGGVGIKTEDKRIDAKTAGEIEAAFKIERARCDAMKTDAEKKTCYERIVATLKAKFANVDDSLFRALNGEKTVQGKAGTNLGFDDKDNNRGEEKRDGDEKKNDDSNKKSFIENFSIRFGNVINKLLAINNRLVKVADRIDSRIAKLNSEKVNTDESVKLVANAREELRLASISTTNANISFKMESGTTTATTTIDASNYKTVYAKTLSHIKSAKEHLIKAHRYLVQAVTTLKPGLNKDLKVDTSLDVKTN